MRLINTKNLELHDFYRSEIPGYAILSHTWGDDEVTFQDMSYPARSKKKGYTKITQTCRQALRNGLNFAWVDTCCIDKSSSAELTESINSMFQWYSNAAVCYVFLDDFRPNSISVEEELARCRWFTRGWTLQELIAPKTVEFYDMAWNYIGSKLVFSQTISNYTGIPDDLLVGRSGLENRSVASKMSWAAHRQTTRVEDIGYCLLGIFDVSMPLIYGEGVKAFRRLQEEIVKRSNDLTIFAWDNKSYQSQFGSLFAPSPAGFVDSSNIKPFRDDFPNFAVTNKGLLVSGDIPMRTAVSQGKDGVTRLRYLLFLGSNKDVSSGGIYLRKFGPKLFIRDWNFPLAGFGVNDMKQVTLFDTTDYYIFIDPIGYNTISPHAFRDNAIHVPFKGLFTLEDTIPETLWDHTDRVFLRPKPYKWARYPMVIAMLFHGWRLGHQFRLVVLCDGRPQFPTCKVFSWSQYRNEAKMIFQERHRNEFMYWADPEIQNLCILPISNHVEIKIDGYSYNISVSFERGAVQDISNEAELFSIKFTITEPVMTA